MGGLLKDFALTALIIILNHYFYGVEDSVAYKFIVDFMAQNQTMFLAGGILGSIGLLVFSTMFEGLGIYKITYALSKVFVRLSQFFITFITLLNIVFYAAIGYNLMRDNGYFLLFVFGLVLGASCWSLRMIDFNYHSQNAILPVGILAFMSIFLVEFIWPFFFNI
jgi:hypothetical protein